MTYPSIYDLSPDFLRQFDWSHPLVVQACRGPFFRESVAVLTERLAIAEKDLTLLGHPGDLPAPGWPGRCLVNPEAWLSPDTHTGVDGFDRSQYSVMVVITQAPLHDQYEAMRGHSGVACFCHSLAPLPTLVVDPSGHVAGTDEGIFGLREHPVGPHKVLGSIHMSNAEIRGLYESALGRPDGAVVEIGRFAGGSAMVLACAGRDTGRRGVISIDIERLPCVDYLLNVNGFMADDITLVDIDAAIVAKNWPVFPQKQGVSFLLIDADHSYEGVQRDLQAWTPYLVPGALVAFHDVNNPQFAVTRAIYHHVYRNPQFSAFEQFDSLLVAQFFGAGQPNLLAHHEIATRTRQMRDDAGFLVGR